MLREELGVGQFGRVWSAVGPGAVTKALKFIAVNWSDPDQALREYCGIQRIRDVRGAFLVPMTDIWLLDKSGRVLEDSAMAVLDAHVQQSGLQSAGTIVLDDRPEHIVVAMELCERTLTQELERCVEQGERGIPPEALLSYTRDAARGIDFLHEKRHRPLHGGTELVSLAHGDVKPDNIMLTGGGAKLCDFTLAEALHSTGEQLRKTMTKPAGTLIYMPPEVARGNRSDRSDQYSLAITYFQLRTNALPFSGEALSSIFQLQESKEREDLLMTALPTRERVVLERALNAKPEKRFASCVEMVEALEDAFLNRTGPAPPVPTRGSGVWRALTAVALCGVLAVAGYQMLAPPQGSAEQDRVAEQLLGRGLAAVGSALDALADTPESQRPKVASNVVDRLGAEAADAEEAGAESLRGLLAHAVRLLELTPGIDDADREKLSDVVGEAASALADVHRDTIDAQARGGDSIEPQPELAQSLGASLDLLSAAAEGVESNRLDQAVATIELQAARLAARHEAYDKIAGLGARDLLGDSDRQIAEVLSLLADIEDRRTRNEWPPRSSEQAKALFKRFGANLQSLPGWEGARAKETRTELVRQIPVECFIDPELSLQLVGVEAFGDPHLRAIDAKITAARGAPDFDEIVSSVEEAAEAEADWLSDQGDQLAGILARERLVAELMRSKNSGVIEQIREWPTMEPAMRDPALAAAIEALRPKESGSSGERLAALLTLRDEFASEPTRSDSHLANCPFRRYAEYARGLRLARLEGGVSEEALTHLAVAYPPDDESDPGTDDGSARILQSDFRRRAAVRVVADTLVTLNRRGVPDDRTLAARGLTTRPVQRALPLYRSLASSVDSSADTTSLGADAIWLYRLLERSAAAAAESELVVAAATKLLASELAEGRRGGILLARALAGAEAGASDAALSDLAASVEALAELLDADSVNWRFFSKRVVTPAAGLASSLGEATRNNADRRTLAAIYERLAGWHVLFAPKDPREQQVALGLYERAAELEPTPKREIEREIAFIYSPLWKADRRQLQRLRRVGEKHRDDRDDLVAAGAKICLGMAAIGESRGIVGDRQSRAARLREAIETLGKAEQRLRTLPTDPAVERRIVSCLSTKATAHVEYSFYDVSSKEELDQAIVAARRATRLDREHVPAWNSWGNAHEDLALYLLESPSENYPLAIEKFERANDLVQARALTREAATLGTRANLVRCRKRWLAAGLYGQPGAADDAKTQIAALIAESERVREVVAIIDKNPSRAPAAAQLLFFLADGLKACEEYDRAEEAALACGEVAAIDLSKTGAVWCDASLLLAMLVQSEDPVRSRSLTDEILASPHASAGTLTLAAGLPRGEIDAATYQTRLAEVPEVSAERSADLQLTLATQNLPIITARSTPDDYRRIEKVVAEARDSREAASEAAARRFESNVAFLLAQEPLYSAAKQWSGDRDSLALAEKFAGAIERFAAELLKFERSNLPPALARLVATTPDEWGDVDPLVMMAAKKHHQRFNTYRNAIWVLALPLLESESKIESATRESLLAVVRTAFRVSDELTDLGLPEREAARARQLQD